MDIDKEVKRRYNSLKEILIMKKSLGILALLFCMNTAAFSLSESWLFAGFEYGNSFEKITMDGQKIEPDIAAPGFAAGFFLFWDAVGVIILLEFLFPQNVSLLKDQYTYNFQLAYIAGPAFQFGLNERMKITLGAGFGSVQTFGKYGGASLLNSNYGIGGDAGFVYSVTPRMYINAGTAASYQFTNLATLNTGKNEKTERSKNYSMISLRPYIRIGYIFKSKLGTN